MCKTFKATVDISREQWDAIQASWDADFRCVDENGNPLPQDQLDPYLYGRNAQIASDIIKKYNLKCGTSPFNAIFKFENGVKIYMDWFIEEWGGVIRWGDSDYNSMDESGCWLDEETVFDERDDGNTEVVLTRYVCRFNIID